MTCLAGHGEICPPPPRVGDPHGDPHTSPQHADSHRLGAFLKKTIQEIHVDRRVVGWSASRHVDHPCGVQISPWPARKVTELFLRPGVGQFSPHFGAISLRVTQKTWRRRKNIQWRNSKNPVETARRHCTVTRLSRRFGRPLTKKVMSHSPDGPGVPAPLRTNIVPLTGVWNPPPLPLAPLKKPPTRE